MALERYQSEDKEGKNIFRCYGGDYIHASQETERDGVRVGQKLLPRPGNYWAQKGDKMEVVGFPDIEDNDDNEMIIQYTERNEAQGEGEVIVLSGGMQTLKKYFELVDGGESHSETQGDKKKEADINLSGISQRTKNASKKIQERVNERFIPNYKQYDAGAKGFGQRWLSDLHNDFYKLAENPEDEVGDGNYVGWNPDEIKELFFVLYGEKM